MKLNRELQNSILHIAANCYPMPACSELDALYEPLEEQELAANLLYLEQHRLIEEGAVKVSIDGWYNFGIVTITHIGMDFLADDGGLSAILNVVTVKFEAETLKSIIATKINQSELPPAEKKSMIDALEELPAESIKHLTTKLLDECVDNLPGAILLIGSWLSSF